METAWFVLVALMLTAYVVLDGFDLGAGAISLFIARTHQERTTVFRTIGPVWDGNEVWLIAAGGAVYFAFPVLYASAFSGFYLPLMIVLWLLMLRGMGIELRSHVSHPLWWSLFEFVFAVSSLLLALFFGAAMGNVVPRSTAARRWILLRSLMDGLSCGAKSRHSRLVHHSHRLARCCCARSSRGALRDAQDHRRGECPRPSRRGNPLAAVVSLTVASLVATLYIRPDVLANFRAQPVGWLSPCRGGRCFDRDATLFGSQS
jgi:cytochrome d ubiquinol oxidase subunit II